MAGPRSAECTNEFAARTDEPDSLPSGLAPALARYAAPGRGIATWSRPAGAPAEARSAR